MATAKEIEKMVKNFSEWQLGGGKFAGAEQEVDVLNSWREKSGLAFNLKNSVQVRYIGWEKQTFGVNLGYSDDATTETAHKMARWFFRRQDGSTRKVRYGELIAMGYGTSPSFYKYAVTTIGINLKNTPTPSYEWRLIGPPGTAGQPVKTGQWLAIWNEVEDGFLIYFDRDAGVDLGWPDGKTWGQQIIDLAWKAAKEAAKAYIESYVGVRKGEASRQGSGLGSAGHKRELSSRSCPAARASLDAVAVGPPPVELWPFEALATAPTTGKSGLFAHVVSVTLPAAQVNGYPHQILAGHRTVKVGAKVGEC